MTGEGSPEAKMINWNQLLNPSSANKSLISDGRSPLDRMMGFTSSEKAIHDYEKIRRLFIYGFSALIYYKIILPDLVELHKTVRDMDKIATSMLKSRGEMIPPSPPVKFNKPFGDPSDLSCVDLNGNFL